MCIGIGLGMITDPCEVTENDPRPISTLNLSQLTICNDISADYYYSCGPGNIVNVDIGNICLVSGHCGHSGGSSKIIWDSNSKPHR
jgi:hypothetical protein